MRCIIIITLVFFSNTLFPKGKPKVGSPAPVFSLENTAGKFISLNDFKGKVVYLDFWFSKCTGCIKNIPFAKEVEKYFAGKDVVFINVSFDSKKEDWLQTIKKHDIPGVNLWYGNNKNIYEEYKIYGFPRYILIDKNGVVINNTAPWPQSKSIYPEIEKALME